MWLKPKNPFPDYLNEVEARKVNEMRFRLTKILKEFNRRGFGYKARLKLEPCRPYSLCDGKVVFYEVQLITPKNPLGNPEDDGWVATILFRWDLTNGDRVFASIVADYVTSLEDTLNIISLATQLATEFYR